MSGSWWGLLVSALALIFTVGSFWWIQVRRGHLKGYAPHSFAAFVNGASTLFLRFPVVIYNTGAIPIIVLDLRLRFPDVPRALTPLRWRTSRSQLTPAPNDGEAYPGAFAIAGRSAEQRFIEFGGPWPGFEMRPGSAYRCRIEVKLGHNEKWEELVDFRLALPRMMTPGTNTTYSNSPWVPTPEDRQKIELISRELIQRLEEAKRKGCSEEDEAAPTIGSENGPVRAMSVRGLLKKLGALRPRRRLRFRIEDPDA